MNHTSIREELLKTELKHKIENSYGYIDFTKYHHNSRDGFYTSLTNIVVQGTANPKKHKDREGQILGYQIYSKHIHNFKRNKIVKDIGIDKILHKAYSSTYHANNSRGESNGYSHWYLFDESVNNANYMANYRLKKMIERNEKYENTNEKYKDIMIYILTIGAKPRDKHTINYIKIDKQNFIAEYQWFIEGLSEQFSIVLNRVFYWDKHFVYVDNSSFKEVDNESLDGYGRSYTPIGVLSKELRKRLLKGHIELDIETTAQTIFLNLYYMNTIKGVINTDLKQWKKDFPEHYKLITDKKMFRYKIAGLFKVDTKTAKKIITHLTYSPNANVLHAYAKDKAPSVKAKIKVGLKPFLREAKKIRKAVLDKFYYQENDHNSHLKIGNLKLKEFKPLIDEEIRINNLKLKGKGRGKKLDDRIAFRINELVEHQIREKMITLLEYYSKNECIYQIHDAVIIKELPKELSINKILGYINKELGFIIAIIQEQY